MGMANRRNLDGKQKRLLQDYVLTNRATFENQPHEWKEAAKSIGGVLGFEVTEHNLRAAAEIVGVKFKTARPNTRAMGEARAAENEARFLAIENRIARIERELGLPPALAANAGSTTPLLIKTR